MNLVGQKQQFIENIEKLFLEGSKLYLVRFNEITPKNENLTESDLSYITILSETDGLNTSTIAEKMGISRPGVTQGINALVAKGYVEKKEVLSDKRFSEAWLTHKYLEIDSKVMESLLGRFYDSLSGNEKDLFSNVIDRMVKELDKIK